VSSLPPSKPTVSLRERKKLKTHLAIQHEALDLFRKQGYEATTVEQIAAAAEVSQTTFFRYFPTKEDVVLHDALDPLYLAAFEAQPAELTTMEALRGALRETFAGLNSAELGEQRQREQLIRATPELWAGMLSNMTSTVEMLVSSIARRTGRAEDDAAVLAFAGAVIGAGITVWLKAGADAIADFPRLFDAALAQLEAGLTL
jgi:AcrR family transcriptional regulator